MLIATRWAPAAVLVAVAQAGAFVVAALVSAEQYLWWAASLCIGAVVAGALTRLRRRAWTALTAAGTVLSLVGWALPVGGYAAAAPPPGATWLSTPDDDRLWYEKFARRVPGGDAHDPVVVVHGGPAVPLSDAEQRQIARLAEARDVWVYDQIGSGYSSRLEDVDAYTFERAVEDLELVLDRAAPSGTAVLVGYSFGAAVATAYAAEHPHRVSGMILLSPGPAPVAASAHLPEYSPQSELSWRERLRLYGVALRPRNLFIYGLTVANRNAAASLVSDAEADARFADLYERSAPGLVCPEGRAPTPPTHPLGHFAHQVPRPHVDGHDVSVEDLAALQDLPVLLLRGECDYIRYDVVEKYLELLPGARAVEVPGAGHSPFAGAAATTMSHLRTFLETL